MHGIVFDIQRFALHDGPGIRTTVFLKGCPLNCLWCHNPESRAFAPQLSYNPERCTHCMDCVTVCRQGAHQARAGRHVVDFGACAACGDCVAACPHGALAFIGRAMTVEQVMDDVMRDADYYRRSGGGLTLSGGEPMAQFGFAQALLRAAKAEGLDTCLDTSGAVATRKLLAVADDVDLFLYDYKATDPATHKRLTGVDNALILENLNVLYGRGARIVVRCPLVPGVNDSPEHLAGIAALSARYPELEGVDLMAFHNMGRDKAVRIGYANPLKDLPTTDEVTKTRWLHTLHGLGCTRATCS